jgi:hypothetical protein
VPDHTARTSWPRAWTWAIVLVVLLFGAHATMRWRGPALLPRLLGNVPSPADVLPLVWALLVGWVVLLGPGGR